MKTILTAILFASLHTGAMSQILYTVTDVLDIKRSRLEIWTAEKPKDENSLYEVVKEDPAKKEL